MITQISADPELLIQQLELLSKSPDAFAKDESQRQAILYLSKASALLEQPFETLQRINYAALPINTARLAQSMKIFDKLLTEKEVTAKSLADCTNLEIPFVESVMDYLCAQHLALEVHPQVYAPTRLTSALNSSLGRDSLIVFNDLIMPCFNAMTKASSPGATQKAFSIGHNTPDTLFEWFAKNPVISATFQRFMQAQFSMLPPWFNVIPFDSELAPKTSSEDVLMVDVGGGFGQQCELLRKHYPDLQGRVILQDRPDIIKIAPDLNGVEKMVYDYFTEQPVKNARAYYFRQIFHDNTDADCIKMFKNHIPAMGPESIILIDDKVLPNEKSPETGITAEYLSALSIVMKTCVDAQERREAHWRRLIAEAGLKVKDIRLFTPFRDAIIMVAKE